MIKYVKPGLELLLVCAIGALFISWVVQGHLSPTTTSLTTSSYEAVAQGTLNKHLATISDTIDTRCPFNTRALRGGFYQVLRVAEGASSVETVSQHTRLDKAVVSATEIKSLNTQDSVWIEHDFELIIECPD